MIGKRFRSLPFIFANDNYTLSSAEVTVLLEKFVHSCNNRA